MDTNIPSPKGPFRSRKLATSRGRVSSRHFSYSQSEAAQTQSYRPHLLQHVFQQPRSATGTPLPSRKQSSSVSFSQKGTSSASNNASLSRSRRSTHLPTPRIPLPTKPMALGHHWQRITASQPSGSSFKKRAKKRNVGIGIDNVRRRTFVSKPGLHHKRVVPNRVQQSRAGIWMDKHGRLRNPDSDSDSMELDQPASHDDDSDVELVRLRLSARKNILLSSESDDGQEEEESVPESEFESNAPSDVEDDADSDVAVIGDNIGKESIPVPSSALLQAIQPFLPQIPPQNLPFLRRTLRTAFKRSFVNYYIGSPSQKVILRVLLRATSDQSRCSFTLDSWSCPLCHLLGELDSRQMLDSHLHWHHSGVEVFWLKEEDLEWRLILSFPVPPTSQSERSIAPYFYYASIKEVVDKADHNIPANQSITSLTLEDEEDPDVDVDANVRMSPTTPVPDTPASAMSLSFAELSMSSASIAFRASQGRSIAVAEEVQHTPSDSRYPTPPPADNPLGPAARYPYLPATSDDGKIVIQYSCRAGGPYLYDLLDLLPLDEFGVLSWLVLDREAEIFENEDISDESKVMHALWSRWIMLNKERFIQDYLVGTIDFVDKYWLIIHQAAGWSALRYWLMMLMVNKYLQASEVAHVLKHYEEKTGMKYWYNNFM
ncbi:hypothetical protein DFJ43DRAFT_272692 [Lentinula guzmanii]|uniref:Uncharacterized protein n=1 Tax=Lentinula guzmanii TaxID=2804957 RepID=A0AA38JP87_9AGAR|nr:hypothetical protein DFJ43DRAFT_272692 [Lentinula guzmanii]